MHESLPLETAVVQYQRIGAKARRRAQEQRARLERERAEAQALHADAAIVRYLEQRDKLRGVLVTHGG